MNFITEYVSLLMQHPLATPVASVGLLALTLHLVLPLLCEIWRYYPNKITGKETLKNWYTSKIGTKVWRSYFMDYVSTKHWCDFDNEEEAKEYTKQHNLNRYNEKRSYYLHIDNNITGYTCKISVVSIAVTVAALLIEYLLANFFIYTLVAGLAVGLHFTVVLLGKKLYSVSEDVKALKEYNDKEKQL